VEKKDAALLIWHLPHEKKYGILSLYKRFARDIKGTMEMTPVRFKRFLSFHLTIPDISAWIYAVRLLPVQAARIAYRLVKRN
jgi:hypothetical protein